MDKDYNIIFCCDDNYVKYCAVCMQSLAESCLKTSCIKANRGGAE